MTLQIRQSSSQDRAIIHSLLQTTKLPTESLDQNTTTFYMAEDGGQVVGIAGFEFYESDALLRSVAVQPKSQHHGLGSKIVNFMLEEAKEKNIQTVVLLTETAKDFFLKIGFEVVDRSTIVNEDLKKSSEFAYACPKSAICMRLRLK